MRAQIYSRYGGPEVLEFRSDCAQPEPGQGEVLLEVRASAVNPVDWKLRRGNLRRIVRARFPVIPGRDLCGRVLDCGPRATMFVPGDVVFGVCPLRGPGSHADRVSITERQLALAPTRLDHREAAALPLVGLTAVQAVEAAQIQQGSRVLVHGGAGGVGSIVVQYARYLGAKVWATASARNLDYLRALGVDAIDYGSERFEERTSRVEAVIDCVGGHDLERRSFSILRRGGLLVSVTGPDPEAQVSAGSMVRHVLPALARIATQRARGVQYRFISARSDHKQLVKLARLAAAGAFDVRIDRSFELEQLAEAHAYGERGEAQGKLVITH